MKKWIPDSGVNALDLIGSKIVPSDKLKAESLLAMNYGIDYPKEKFSMLWEMVQEDGWSKERLTSTIKWFLKNKKFPNWTIADFFEHETPKLFPYSKYLTELAKNRSFNDEIEWFKVDGQSFWAFKSDNLSNSGFSK